jgi:acyl carrier protein
MKKKIKLNLPPPQTLTVGEIKTTIANILFKQMGIDPALTLADTPFMDLHNDFDSLSMMELLLLLEDELHFEINFKMHDKQAVPPNIVSEMALEVLHQYTAHMSNVAALAAKTALADTASSQSKD